jgi:hypothetical protein
MSYGNEPVLRSVASPIGQMDLLGGGVIRHVLEPAALVDAKAAAEVLRLTAELAAGGRVAVLVDLRAIGFADDDAQAMFSTSDAGGVEVATALVAHGSIASYLVKRFTTKMAPVRPVKIFESPFEALAWAREMVAG